MAFKRKICKNADESFSFCPPFLSDFVTKETVKMAIKKVSEIPSEERRLYLKLVRKYPKSKKLPVYYADKLSDPFDPQIMKTIMEKIPKRAEVEKKNELLPLIALELIAEYDRRHKIKEMQRQKELHFSVLPPLFFRS